MLEQDVYSWIRRLTSNLKIAGSSHVVVNVNIFPFMHFADMAASKCYQRRFEEYRYT